MRLLKLMAAAIALLTCLLSGSGFAAVTRPKPHRHSVKPATTGANSIFVANPTGGSLSVFPGGSSGNVPSLVTNPGLASPSGIARDAAGNIYVANSGGSAIAVFAQGATGSPNPIGTIEGSNTGLNYPVGVALDSSGNIYVADAGSSDGGTDNIFVYPPGSNGNVSPTAVISGASTGLHLPSGLALDSSDKIYVTNVGSQDGTFDSVTVYSAGSNGNVMPVITVAGSSTGLSTPEGITVDSSGNIYVTNDDYGGGDIDGTIEEFLPGSTGNATPTVTIYGSCSGLDTPQAVAVDSAGNIYVANNGQLMSDPNIAMYAAGSDGCATPSAIISGAATGLIQPAGLTLDSSLNIYVTIFTPTPSPSSQPEVPVTSRPPRQLPIPIPASTFLSASPSMARGLSMWLTRAARITTAASIASRLIRPAAMPTLRPRRPLVRAAPPTRPS
ncbi:MAG: SBBP repeat-containing protein [Candidatus Binataceae bacterium]|nr:SBBP repeat-containing protein [Candidatus Binataceae bacterium]